MNAPAPEQGATNTSPCAPHDANAGGLPPNGDRAPDGQGNQARLGPAHDHAGRGQPNGAKPRHVGGRNGRQNVHKNGSAGQRKPPPHYRKRPRRFSEDEPVYAALDLGTNNCRLLVARATRNNFRVIDAFSRVIRLGEGLAGAGVLANDAMDRAIDALSACRDKLVINGVNRHRLIATEACRRAKNGAAFLERVRLETGLNLEIVSRETEAHLAVAGCASLIDSRATGVVVFDIGGGSTELVVLDLTRVDAAELAARRDFTEAVVGWTSLPVGVVGIAESHGGVRVTRDSFAGMVDEVERLLQGFEALDALDGHDRDNVHLLGTSGTVTTIAGVHLGLKRYDRRRVDGTWMAPEAVVTVNERLCAMSYKERAANACIGRDRADLVLAGCAIFEAIRRRWDWARVRVADRGLREGILMSLMGEDGAWTHGHRNAGGRS